MTWVFRFGAEKVLLIVAYLDKIKAIYYEEANNGLEPMEADNDNWQIFMRKTLQSFINIEHINQNKHHLIFSSLSRRAE